MNKLIHQIWVGPYAMPVQERYFTRDVRLKNPTWDYVLWTDANLPELPEPFKVLYDKFGQDKAYAFQADVLRLFLIKEYGGLYLDVDFSPVGSFDKLADQDHLFCTWNNLVLNGVFGANKNHPAICSACNHLSTEVGWYGPSWFTKVLEPHTIQTITLEDFEQKYAKHYALNSWATNIDSPTYEQRK